MDKVEIKPGIYWVGAIDWDLRDFHGYTTDRGSTYNAYLIVDEKVVLVDTVKKPFFDEMLSRIKEIVDPARIDYIVSNHVEMDHSGSLPLMLDVVPNAIVLASPRGKKGLVRHYKKELNLKVVESGETLKIGERTLQFVHIPMVHWPDSMVTYVPEEKLLLPNDAFGQHLATSERFDDEICWDILREEAAKYYSNIVLPFGGQVGKALEALSGLEIDMIAPSHGIIWRTWLPRILEEYKKWSSHETENRAVIVYDTMWGSTELIARKLEEGLREAGIPTVKRSLKVSHTSDVMADVLTSKLVLIGSPTINNSMLASMGGFLTYMKGLKPLNRIGFVFGSYGWGGQAIGHMEDIVKELKWEMPLESINIKFVPDEDELDKVRQIGFELGKKVKE
ncbi:MAG: FprA family A-type flavoprotein [Thermoplasmata archaeon]|nr:FprA family A-type flavoprotein [Thermoplasmata archaeon]